MVHEAPWSFAKLLDALRGCARLRKAPRRSARLREPTRPPDHPAVSHPTRHACRQTTSQSADRPLAQGCRAGFRAGGGGEYRQLRALRSHRRSVGPGPSTRYPSTCTVAWPSPVIVLSPSSQSVVRRGGRGRDRKLEVRYPTCGVRRLVRSLGWGRLTGAAWGSLPPPPPLVLRPWIPPPHPGVGGFVAPSEVAPWLPVEVRRVGRRGAPDSSGVAAGRRACGCQAIQRKPVEARQFRKRSTDMTCCFAHSDPVWRQDTTMDRGSHEVRSRAKHRP